MYQMLFQYLELINDFIWGHINFLIIIGLGLYFSWRSRFFQLRKFSKIVSTFIQFSKQGHTSDRGMHPLKAFYAAIGGCIGIGNVVGICTAVQIGGPGAVFWTWIAGFLGMLLKYSEVYLGILHRVPNRSGSYDGGPMYFLKKAFNVKWIPALVCILLCIYGVEVYMFTVIIDSISLNWHMNKYILVCILLVLSFFAVAGGIKRVGDICAKIIPLFLILYAGMSLWVIFMNFEKIPEVFALVFKAAFTPQAAIGAFAGSSIMLTIAMGMSRGCYAADIGIGYASVIHSESSTTEPAKQASLAIFGIFLDSFVVCTLSLLVVLITDVWKSPMSSSLMVQEALGNYFPHMNLFMPFFLFLLGYSTIIAYFSVGTKSAEYLSSKFGKKIYYLYALIAFILFSFVDPSHALIVMSLAGAMLLMINLSGIFKLRNEIQFRFEEKEQPLIAQTATKSAKSS